MRQKDRPAKVPTARMWPQIILEASAIHFQSLLKENICNGFTCYLIRVCIYVFFVVFFTSLIASFTSPNDTNTTIQCFLSFFSNYMVAEELYKIYVTRPNMFYNTKNMTKSQISLICLNIRIIVTFSKLYTKNEYCLEERSISHHNNMETYWYKMLDCYIIIDYNRTPQHQKRRKKESTTFRICVIWICKGGYRGGSKHNRNTDMQTRMR